MEYFMDKTWSLRFFKKLPFLRNTDERIYIFPTRSGFYFLSIIFTLFIISMTYGHSLAFTASFLFFSVILVSMFYTHFNLSDIKFCYLKTPQYFTENTEPILHFYFKQKKKRRLFDLELYSKEMKDTTLVEELLFNAETRFTLVLKGKKRGIYHLDHITVMSSFPFGLFYSWRHFKISEKILVIPTPQFSYEKTRSDFAPESSKNRIELTRGDFKEHRIYQEGDSWRSIDWKAYARTRSLLIKNYETSIQEKILASYDQQPGDSKTRLSNLCGKVLWAYDQGLIFALVLPGSSSGYGEGRKHLQHCLEMLATWKEAPSK